MIGLERAKRLKVEADNTHEATVAELEERLQGELRPRRVACAKACREALAPLWAAFVNAPTREGAAALLDTFREQDRRTRNATAEALSAYHLALPLVDLELEHKPDAVLAFGDGGPAGSHVYTGLQHPAQKALQAKTRPEIYDAAIALEAAVLHFCRERGANDLAGARRRYEVWRSTTACGCAETSIAAIRTDEERARRGISSKISEDFTAERAAATRKAGIFERVFGKFTGASAP